VSDAPAVPAAPAWTKPPAQPRPPRPAGALDHAAISALVRERFPDVLDERLDCGEPWLRVPAEQLLAVLAFVRDDPRLACTALHCLGGFDWSRFAPPPAPKPPAKTAPAPASAAPALPPPPGDLGCAYHLGSYALRHRIALKVFTPRAAPSIPSASALFPVAGYFEREVFDLFGIAFPGHADLRRIMCPDDWVGHPLRKDYVYPESYGGVLLKRAGQRFDEGPYATASAEAKS
jgi:NADH-quinone oxidoreductase subunit C